MDKSVQKDDTSLTLFWSSISSFANHYQFIDTQGLASCYLLICYSNGFALLIKVGEQADLSKFYFCPKVQFGTEKAQNRLRRRPLCCPPRGRKNASTDNTWPVRGNHAAGRPHHGCCAAAAPSFMLGH